MLVRTVNERVEMTQRRLILMRHGKSGYDEAYYNDFVRRLAPRGQQDVPRMGAWLRREGRVPDFVYSSTAFRAYETALLAVRGLNFAEEAIEFKRELYLADVGTLLACIRAAPAYKTIMLIAHNPGLDGLVEELCGHAAGRRDDGKLMATSAVAVIAMPKDWTGRLSGEGKLEALMRPADLD